MRHEDLSALSVRELQTFIEAEAEKCATARRIVTACEDALARAHDELRSRLVDAGREAPRVTERTESWATFVDGARGVSASRATASAPTRCRSRSSVLLNDLVGPDQQRLRDRQPQRLRGLQVDHELELGGLLDWDINGLGALERILST
jgi:hypothetical protein